MAVEVVRGFTLTLPFPDRPPMLMNELRSRSHWRGQHKAHREVKDAVWVLCQQQKPGRFDRVTVQLVWRVKDARRRDPDALAPLVKGCLDGLVAAGVLKDDSCMFVDEVRLRIEPKSSNPGIELMVSEA